MKHLADDPAFKAADEGATAKVSCSMEDLPILIGGVRPSGCTINTRARRIVRKLSLASVVAYSAPQDADLSENAQVQNFDMTGFEILQSSDRVAVVIDLTNAAPPAGCFFDRVAIDFGRLVAMRWIKPIGLREAINYSALVKFRFEWP
jgi:hypothetical protein